MKKIISIICAVMMTFAVASVSTVAFAATVNSPETTVFTNEVVGQVNGSPSKDVTYKVDPKDPTKVTFTYTGKGDLDSWDFEGMTEGVDYTVLSKDGNTITIQLLNGYSDEIIANVSADLEDGETTTKNSANINDSSTSPNTGVIAGTGIALMGAGVAVLATLKKKSDAE